MNTKKLKELRNALSCWQDDYDCDDDKEQYDMFGAAIDAVSRLEAAELEIEGLKRFQDLNLKIKQAMHERFTRAERERDELRLEIARIGGAKSIEVLRRDAAAGEPVAVLYRNGDVLTKAECGEYFEICCKVETPLYTAALPAVLPELEQDVKNIIGLLSENEWAEHCTKSELGRKLEGEITRLHDLRAQQQKVVELPEPVRWPEIPFKYFSEEQVFSMLDAASVKWEVKT